MVPRRTMTVMKRQRMVTLQRRNALWIWKTRWGPSSLSSILTRPEF
uniref:Uncharacterized protein n=1 Tax=Rhizophora mucronata TaxID=61149 RepID=A0A2P2NVB9_RHIMU